MLLDVAWKSLAVGGGTLLILWLLRRASAQVRHLVCAVGIALIASVPLACLATRTWLVPALVVSLPRPTMVRKAAPVNATSAPLPSVETRSVPASRPVSHPKRRLAPSAPARNWFTIGLGVWALGSGVCFLPWLAAVRQLWRMKQGAQPPSDRLLQLMAPVSKGSRRVLLLLSDTTSVPLTAGVWRPMIVLPAVAETWPGAQVVTALRHEMAHITRGDFLTQNLAYLVCAFYWFHPLVWLLSARLRAEAETACDTRVVGSGVAATEYATHLLEIAKNARCFPISRAASAMTRTSDLEGRIRMILTEMPGHLSRRQLMVATCGVLGLITLLGVRIAAKAEPSVPPRGSARNVALPPAPPSDPAAVELLKQSMDVYAGLKTFRADVDYVMAYSDTEPLEAQPLIGKADYQRTIAYAAPNRFRITATNYKDLKFFYLSDGKRMAILTEGYNHPPRYFDAPNSLAVADKNEMDHPHFGGSPLYRFFGGRDGYDRLIDAETAWTIQKAPPQAVRFGPDVTVAGEPCKTVIFGGGLYDDERRAIISTRDYLVRRMEFRKQGHHYTPAEVAARVREAQQRDVPADLKKALVYAAKRAQSPNSLSVEHYSNLVMDAPIADSEFKIPATK